MCWKRSLMTKVDFTGMQPCLSEGPRRMQTETWSAQTDIRNQTLADVSHWMMEAFSFRGVWRSGGMAEVPEGDLDDLPKAA